MYRKATFRTKKLQSEADSKAARTSPTDGLTRSGTISRRRTNMASSLNYSVPKLCQQLNVKFLSVCAPILVRLILTSNIMA